MPVALNDKTGEALRLDDAGAWVPTRIAQNPQTGERLAFDGAAWVPVAAPERSTAANVLRKADFASKGFLDRAAEIVTAPADLIWEGAKALGLPTPGVSAADTLKGGIHAVGNAMNSVVAPFLPSDMGANQPETTGERFVEGAGRGVADTLGVLVPGAAAAKLGQAGGLVQRAGQALTTQPVLQAVSGAVGGGTAEATGNPWLGLLASLGTAAAPAAASRTITPVRGQLNAEQRRLANVAQQEGIGLSPAQASGSRPLQNLESGFGTLPLTAGPQRVRQEAQRAQFNRAALRRAGINGDSATPDVLDAARQRLGDEFQRLSAATTVRYDQPFVRDLMATVRRYANRLDAQRRPVFENFVNDITGSGGSLDGATYQTVRSDLGTIAKNAAGNDPTLAQALRGLRNALDDAAERSMPPNLRGDWREVRREYGNLKVIEKAMSGTTVDAASGNIPPTAFSQAVRAQHPRAHGFGAGEMNDLSRVGRLFVRDNIPNSGTPERSMMVNLLTGGGGLGALFSGGDAAAAAGGALVGLLGPRAAQMAYHSPPVEAYLRNRILQNGPTLPPELIAAIITAQTRVRQDD